MFKKLCVFTLCILMAVAFMPVSAFAAEESPLVQGMAQTATNIKTDKDANGKEYYTQITLDPYTFYDVANGSKKTLDDAAITDLVKNYLLDDWVEIANGCFRTSGKCATIQVREYDKYFNNSNPDSNAKGDIREYLKDKAQNKGSKGDHSYVKSGIHVATSLGDAREAMAEQIAGQISRRNLRAEHILSGGGPSGGALKEMADDKTENNTVVYSIATAIPLTNITKTSFCYDSFGIAFYDFHPCAIQAENLKYKSALDGLDPNEIKEKGAPGVSYESSSTDNTGSDLTNNSDKTSNGSVTRVDSYESSLTNDFESASEKTFGQTINHTLAWGADSAPWGKVLGHMETSIGFSFQEMYSAKEGHSKTESHKTETSATQSVTMDPQTYLSVQQGKKDQTLQSDYDTPVQVSYKVAIFAMSGQVYADGAGIPHKFNTATYEQGNYLNIIGADSSFGVSANENLHLRAIENKTTGRDDAASGGVIHRYWINHGGSSYNTTNVGTKWNSGYMASDAKTKAAIANQATKIPMLSCGCKYSVTYKTNSSTLNDPVPLYLPARFVLKQGNDAYDVTVGQELNLSKNLTIGCVNKNNVDYSAFSPDHGQWVICDYKGTPGPSSCVDLTTSQSGEQILKARTSGVDYITWKMKDSVKYLSKNETGSVTSKDNLASPIIKINAGKEAFQGRVEVSGEFDGCVGDEGLNLYKILKAKVYDLNDKQVDKPVYWEAQNLPEEGITIDSNGDIHLSEEGTYNIRAVVSNAGTGADDVRSSWFPITVKPARQLTEITFAPMEEDVQNRVMESPEGTTYKYDLLSYIRGYDQYGALWNGSLDNVSFALLDEVTNAYIDDEGMLCITGEEDVAVKGLLKGQEISGSPMMSISVADNLKGSPERMKLQYGKSGKLEMFDYYGNPLTEGLTFLSENEKVAMVSEDGTVKATGVGTAKITVKDAGGGTETCIVTVIKASQKLSVKGKTVKLKAKKLKKKSQKIARKNAVSVSKAQGNVTYSKVKVDKKKFAKKFKINKKTGIITVGKGVKKGTYKMQIKVKAAGNKNYKAMTKKTTIKIVVK